MRPITRSDKEGIRECDSYSYVDSSSSIPHTSSTARRLYLLAAALSISPTRLFGYTNVVHCSGARCDRGGEKKGDGNRSHGAKPEDWMWHPSSGVSVGSGKGSSRSMFAVQEDTMLSHEMPPLLHGILSVLVLPFTNLSQSSGGPFVAVASSTDLKDTGNKRHTQPRSGDKGAVTPISVGSPSILKDGSPVRPLLVNMQEHFASLREPAILRPVNSYIEGGESGSPNPGSCNDHNVSSGSISTSGDSWDDSLVSRLSSPMIEKREKEGQGVNTSPHEGNSKRHHCSAHHYRRKMSHRYDMDTSNLLSELAEPILGVDTHSVIGRINQDSRMDPQQSLQLLPRELHTTSGVARLIQLYPPFLPLLLETLLKECVHEGQRGLVARYVVVRLTELSAPVLISTRSRWKSARCDIMKEENGVEYYAIMMRAIERLATTATSLLDLIEDPLWTLNLCTPFVASQLLEASAVLPIIHRSALALAKNSSSWNPAVALSYCIVTHQSLRTAVHAEEELSARRRGVEKEGAPLLWPLDETHPVEDTDVGETPRSRSQSRGEQGCLEKTLSSSLEQSELLSMQGERRRLRLPSQQWGVLFDEAFGRSRSRSVTSSVDVTKGSADFLGSSTSLWRFPDKVPPTAIMPNAIVMTCMILCAGTLSQQTVVTLGQWCLRSLSVSQVTPCAVGLAHLMMKYPHFLEKVSLRSFSSPQNSSSSHSPSCVVDTAATTTSNSTSKGGVYVTTQFCDAVFTEGCRLANAALRRQETLSSDGCLARVWQCNGTVDFDEMGSVRVGCTVLYELQDVQCYLVMILQALTMRRGKQLSTEAQDELVSLFVSISRIRVAVGTQQRTGDISFCSPIEKEEGEENAAASSVPSGKRFVPFRVVVKLVDESFRAVARAVDIILHDYDAGCPRRLCEALVLLLPPQNLLFSELERVGAWEKHLDCLETVQAAAEAYREAIRSSSAPPSSTVFMQHEISPPKNSRSETSPHQKKSFPRPLSLLHLHEELKEKAKSTVVAAAMTRSSAEVMFGSLIGVLPSSGEPLHLSADDHTDTGSGGLTAAQQHCWLQHMIVYLVEGWWRNRVSMSAQFPLYGDTDNDTGDDSALLFTLPKKSFLECCAHPI